MFGKCKAESVVVNFNAWRLNPSKVSAGGGDREAEKAPVFVGYFDLGDGNILPCGLTETERLQAVKDSRRRTRDELSARLRGRCADLRSQRG